MTIVFESTRQRLALFAALLETWNSRINLVARGDAGAIAARHVADSLAVLPLLPPGATRAVDLGSGGGFPGMVVAVASGIACHLVERDQRKGAFLREAARVTAAPATVHTADMMSLAPLRADLVLSRATASLSVLVAAGFRHAAKGATMLFHKSRQQEAEITEAQAGWRFELQRLPNLADPRGEVWRLQGVAPRAR